MIFNSPSVFFTVIRETSNWRECETIADFDIVFVNIFFFIFTSIKNFIFYVTEVSLDDWTTSKDERPYQSVILSLYFVRM